QVYIADSGNHHIQVLNPDLTFSHSFGSEGSANGQFQSPTDIAIDSQGLVYVADQCNNRIQKFSPDGKFVGQFGTEGSGPGQLSYPVGITIDTAATGLVYVSEGGNYRISVFTSDGVFVSMFGRLGSNVDEFNDPYGLAFNKDGFLYVCDFGNDRLAERKLSTGDVPPVLRTDDQLMSEDEVKEIKTGLSAMKTAAVLDIFKR
uniref:SMP-30/Gluconolactonase/LRE-like region domain-containing protein n=1 Tax=Amphimedon queenslandica TaxID=400682 RepID=A0A1X7UZM7_AMPQE